MTDRRLSQATRLLGQAKPALLALFAGLLLTGLIWFAAVDLINASEQARFNRLVERALSAVQRRVQEYELALQGTAGFMAATRSVDREGWREYVGSLDLEVNYPGVVGVGYAERIDRGQLADWLRRTREDSCPGFALKSPGTNESLAVVKYMESPTESHASGLLGLDLLADPAPRVAIHQSTHPEGVALTDRMALPGAGAQTPRFMLLYPVHPRRPESATAMVPARKEATGWVFAVLQADQVMSGANEELDDQLDLDLFDSEAPSSEARIFDRDHHLELKSGVIRQSDYVDRKFSAARTLRIGGRYWSMLFSALPGFHSAANRSTPVAVLVAGILISLLLALVVHFLVSTRSRAEALARAMTQDLVDAKQTAESSNELLQNALYSAERLASEANAASRAKSEFLATMSHEIRTPMNGVLGFTRVLMDTELSADQRSSVEMIHRSGEALLSLINDILDFSRIESGRLDLEQVALDLEQTCCDSVALLQARAAEKGLRLEARYDPRLPRCFEGDPGRIRQVVLNLVGNAIKFTDTGAVTVEATPVAPSDGAPPDSDAGRHGIRVSVRDTGVGIPPEKLGQLFQKFVQADSSTTRRYGGSGLGLAISKSLVELMGGEIGAESTPGSGSCFWFVLRLRAVACPSQPAAPPAPAVSRTTAASPVRMNGPQEPDPVPAPAAPGGLRVLLAEDTPVNQVLAIKLLKKLGHSTDLARTGREAVDRASATRYDVILMDCHMPEMDGYAAASEIRRLEAAQAGPRGAGSRVRIVALTASVMEEDRERCFSSGMDDFVAKPIQMNLLKEALERVGGEIPGPRPGPLKQP